MIELRHYDAAVPLNLLNLTTRLILIPRSTFIYQSRVPKLSFLIFARLENNKLPDNQGVSHWESAYNDVAGLQTTNTGTTLLPSTANFHPSFGCFVLAAIN